MVCENCGRKLDEAALTCPHCGTVTGTAVEVSMLASSSIRGSRSSVRTAVAPAAELRHVATPTLQKTQAFLSHALGAIVEDFQPDKHPFMERFASGGFSQDAVRWWAMKMLPGSNRFNQAFLRVTSRMPDYRARIIMLRNAYTEHGELNPDLAHVALYMRFMQGIECPRIDVNEDDGAYSVPELRFKRFEIQDNETILWSLGRFAAIEAVLPSLFTQYIDGLRQIFRGIDDHTIEYFRVHCELDPTHTAELLEVVAYHINSDSDVGTFLDGARDMLQSISDMFTWMNHHMADEVGIDAYTRSARSLANCEVTAPTLYGADADLYDAIYYRGPQYQAEVEFILTHLGGSEPTVLDLCAGTGSHARLLAERNVRVVGVDRSAAMLSIARRKAPGVRFIESDIRALQIPNQFDAVTCMYGAIHYVEEAQDVVMVLRLAYEHLKPGGVLILAIRDQKYLPESLSVETINGLLVQTFFRKRMGVKGGDLYIVSAVDPVSRRHLLDVHNLFHTDPHRLASWSRMVGFKNVRLEPSSSLGEAYKRLCGEQTVLLVGKRPN